MSAKIKVMSFNLRIPVEKDGINIFDNRKSRIIETIVEESPDLIGFQEAGDSARNWLIRALCPEYTVVGCGRTKDYTGESVVLAYKTERFVMLSSETFWLSPTPSIPETYYPIDQSHCPRICTVACLKHADADGLLWFYNTHTDHKGSIARLLEAEQIMIHISAHVGSSKFVITGDMNARPDTPEIKAFTSSLSNRTVVDATMYITETFHGFGTYRGNDSPKIDYIFTDAKTDPRESYKIPANEINGIYLSDHTPVCAFIELD